MSKDLRELASRHHLLWQGNTARDKESGISTGYPELDNVLPAGGWPSKALVEMTVPYWGMGELRLLLPAMVRLNRLKRQIVWVAPPYLPYAPALVNAGLDLQYVLVVDAQPGNVSWVMERMLYAEACGLVLGWPLRLTALETRRLQLAAEAGGSMGVVLHTADARWQAASAALRLHIHSVTNGVVINILKARGGCLRSEIQVTL